MPQTTHLMNSPRLALSLAALLLAGAATAQSTDAVSADPCALHGKHQGAEFTADHEAMTARVEAELAQLGLSDTQKQDLATLAQLYGERLQAIASRGHSDRQQLLELSPLDPDYTTLTNQVSQESAAAAGEVVNVLSELQRTAFLLLSNEQQDELLRLRAEQRQKLQQRMAEKKAAMDAKRAARPAPLP